MNDEQKISGPRTPHESSGELAAAISQAIADATGGVVSAAAELNIGFRVDSLVAAIKRDASLPQEVSLSNPTKSLEGAYTPDGKIVTERLPDLLRADIEWYRAGGWPASAEVARAAADEILRVWPCLDNIRAIAIVKRDLACERHDGISAHEWGVLVKLVDKYLREPTDAG